MLATNAAAVPFSKPAINQLDSRELNERAFCTRPYIPRKEW